jgi:hypothetical protein
MSGGRMNSFLNSIPGYGGYRSKEQRRDSDRLIRERLAHDYGELADRLGRMANRFANERDLVSVRLISRPHTRLVSFRDRVRSATYGYAPLFAQNSVDEAALEQIAAFDSSLGDGLQPLADSISKLESAPAGTDEFTSAASTLEDVVEGLHQRFAQRSQVIESGQALEPQVVAGLLGPASQEEASLDRRPNAFNLHDGEAITFGGQNFTVIGRVTVELPSGSWRYFQLNGGAGDSWLRVPSSAAGEFQWLQRVSPSGEIGSERLQLGDVSFEMDHQEQGTSEVIGAQGSAAGTPVRYMRYRPFSGNESLQVYDWGADSIALRGATIDPMEIQLWSREGRDAV